MYYFREEFQPLHLLNLTRARVKEGLTSDLSGHVSAGRGAVRSHGKYRRQQGPCL